MSRWQIALALAVVAVPAVIVVGVTNRPPFTVSTAVLVVLFAILVVAVGTVLLSVGLQLAGFDGEAPEIAGRLASDPDQQRLLTRWLERARWARFVGGLAGCTAWFLGTRAHGDLLLFGGGGIAIGAMLAETHHVRPRRGPRTARLDVRTVDDYLMDHDARRMIGVAVVGAGVAVTGVVTTRTGAPTWWGLAALATLGAARLVQQRVVSRPRPAAAPNLLRADDLARELAIGRGLARPATFFALTLIARGGYALMAEIGKPGRWLGVAAWAYALYLWWHNRRLGLDFLLTEQREPLLS